MFICLLCEEKVTWKKYLCFSCSLFFVGKAPKRAFGVTSLYPYSPEVRSLVLGAKVKCSKRSLFCLTQILQNNPSAQKMAASADYILPAPSSLFSRLRGGFDLGWFLAHRLSQEKGARLITAPFSFYFTIKKRSKKKRDGESFDLRPFLKEQKHKKNLLIVDDVFTTGFTLHKLSSHYKKDYNLKLLTLSYARTSRNDF